MKLDKTHYSKEEFQNILAERRLDKRNKKLHDSIEDSVPTERNYLCLKHGNKYSADYVNILFSMSHASLARRVADSQCRA